MESHGQPANGTKESENLQRLDVRCSVLLVGATEGGLIDHATSKGAAGVDHGTAHTSQLEHREICHDTMGEQYLSEPIDTSFPPPRKSLWRHQSALVKDSRAQDHRIHRVIIDTGSDHSAITLAEAKRLGLIPIPTMKKLALVDGSFLEAVSFVILRLCLLEIGLGEVRVNALIFPRLPRGHALLIGHTEIMNHNITARIAERQSGWEQTNGPAFAVDPEPSHYLACALFTSRSSGELTTADGVSGALITDMTDAEQREDDEKQLEPLEVEAAHVLAIRENSMANMATVPSSSSSARSSTESSCPETCEEGSQDTDLTTPSVTPK
ncbi:hypothetical protein PG989_010707 [Apiospora arundinis]